MAQQQSIVIKKVKKGGHGGHHGGAWKVAYADFVTAMMAFFLLLWLLNSVSQDQLQGIANYFMPTIGLKDGKGVGVEGGKREREQGVVSDDYAAEGIVYGVPYAGAIVKAPEEVQPNDEQDSEKIAIVENDLKQEIEKSPEIKEYKDNILLEQTPDGLVINITEKNGKPMFKKNSAELEESTKVILAKVVKIIRFVPNYISIAGHTSATPSINQQYTNWELSADRANATRKQMIVAGMDKEHVAMVVAKADNDLLDPEHPQASINRRIAITLLKHSKITNKRQIAPEALSSPVKEKIDYLPSEDLNDAQKQPAEDAARQAAERIQKNLDALKNNQLRQ